jgi:hypothetical protein
MNTKPTAPTHYVAHLLALIQCQHWLAEHFDAFRETLPDAHRGGHAKDAVDSLERLRDNLDDMLSQLLADGDPATLGDAAYARAQAERVARNHDQDTFPVADLQTALGMRRNVSATICR